MPQGEFVSKIPELRGINYLCTLSPVTDPELSFERGGLQGPSLPRHCLGNILGLNIYYRSYSDISGGGGLNHLTPVLSAIG